MLTTTKPRRSRRDWLTACFVLTAVSVTAVLGGAAQPASADSPETAVLDWNKHALDALANGPTAGTAGAGLPAYVQGIHLAMVQGAVYDAVNAIDGSHEAYLGGLDPAPSNASKAAAVATAAHDTLVEFLEQIPTPLTTASGVFTDEIRTAVILRLDNLRNSALAAALADETSTNPTGAAARVEAGFAAGENAADAMIEARSTNGVPDDGRWGSFRFTCGDEPGQWRPVGVVSCTPPPTGGSDAFAWAAKVKPFVVESNEQFLSKGPNALTSGQYAKEYNEVKALGAAGLVRTGEQLAVFNFFQANPVEMFSRSFRTYALAQGLDLVEQARLFGLFGLAGGDTNITCWEDKAHWSFWRPQTAIRLGDTDGNPKTEKVDGWTSAIATPPYPDHSSGYNCNTGIYMTVAELYFGQGRTNFTVSNPNGTTREYEHFRDVWEDTIDARIYQGIHFRSPDEAGVQIGRDVARWVEKHALQAAK
jgi:hypothetical protein